MQLPVDQLCFLSSLVIEDQHS